jgi:hypothetical protein
MTDETSANGFTVGYKKPPHHSRPVMEANVPTIVDHFKAGGLWRC